MFACSTVAVVLALSPATMPGWVWMSALLSAAVVTVAPSGSAMPDTAATVPPSGIVTVAEPVMAMRVAPLVVPWAWAAMEVTSPAAKAIMVRRRIFMKKAVFDPWVSTIRNRVKYMML